LHRIQPTLNHIAALEAELAPYETLKEALAAARFRYRELIAQFLAELQSRCRALDDAEKQTLVLELLEKDLLARLDTAANRERQALVRFVENLWDKYRVTLVDVRRERTEVENRLERYLTGLGYQ
jgi:type I restriction enzyme M protein